MAKSLFNPDRLELPDKLILNPWFWNPPYFETLKRRCLYSFPLVQTQVLVFDEYALISGFLGYSHLLTLLEFIEGVRDKEIFFLGTAGSLTESIDSTCSVNVTEIYASSIFRLFSKQQRLDLVTLNTAPLRPGKGVSVDLIQRETPAWLRAQVKKGIDIVEMEIFPLRVYLRKPFTAVVVMTDRVTAGGVKVFPHKEKFQAEFVRAYECIARRIHETESHFNP